MLWTYSYFPSQDGPGHVADARYMSDAAYREGINTSQWYRQDPRQYATNSIGQWIMALAMRRMSPEQAEKLLATLCLLAFAAAALFVCRALSPRWGPGSILAVLFATLSQVLFLGFYNWLLACAMGLYLLGAWWKRRTDPTLPGYFSLSAGWSLVFYAHAYAFAVFAAVLMTVAAADSFFSGKTGKKSAVGFCLTAVTLIPAAILTVWLGHLMPADKYLFAPPFELWKDMLSLQSLTFWSAGMEIHAEVISWLLTAVVLTSFLKSPAASAGCGSPAIRGEASWLAGAAVILLIGLLGPAGSYTLRYAPEGWMNGNRGTFYLSSRTIALLPIFLAPWLDAKVLALRRSFCAVLAAACIFHALYAFGSMDRHIGDLNHFRQALRRVPPHSTVGMVVPKSEYGYGAGSRRVDPMTQFGFYLVFDSADTVYFGRMHQRVMSVFPIHALKRKQTEGITHLVGWKMPVNSKMKGYQKIFEAGPASLFERDRTSPSRSADRADNNQIEP